MMIATLLSALALTVIPPGERPVVHVAQGDVQGVRADGVASFKGLPYAAPPVGPLRWRAPQPAPLWTDVRQADRVGAVCIQPPANGDNGVGPWPMSEDCLTLNVFAPADAGTGAPLPVMVWIHGGGYVNGSGTADLYDGSSLARRGVVVVTINYRLGRLGFFDHPALAAERPEGEAGGNYGVMDMIASLEWVRDNIAAFGGDPKQVTIFGESAGGVAVSQLMVAPSARGLFHRAVIQSGLGRQPTSRLSDPSPSGASMQDRGVEYAAELGIGLIASADPLRAIPAETLLEPAPGFYSGDLVIADGQVLPTSVEAAFAAGQEAPVPLIVGTNSDEFPWFRASAAGPFARFAESITPEERDAIRATYADADAYEAEFISDLLFNEPARWLARRHAAAGHPTWLYRFDVYPDSMPEPRRGARHAQERQYVFDTLRTSPWPTGPADDATAAAMGDYWATFAKTGAPAAAGHPVWPAVGEGPLSVLSFRREGPVAEPMPYTDRYDLLERAMDRLRDAGLR